MTGQQPTVPCERAYCPEPATSMASRVDAIRDWLYLCDGHAAEYAKTVFEVTALPAARPTGLQVSLGMALSMWPPKHRTLTRIAAKRLLVTL